MEQIYDGFMNVLIQLIVSTMGILASYAITQLTKYLMTKKKLLVEKIGSQQYNLYQSIAESVYYGIEQQFKGSNGPEKQSEFNKRILSRLPGLTNDDINHFREAVVGKARTSLGTLLDKNCLEVPTETEIPSVELLRSIRARDAYNFTDSEQDK